MIYHLGSCNYGFVTNIKSIIIKISQRTTAQTVALVLRIFIISKGLMAFKENYRQPDNFSRVACIIFS